MSKKIFYLLNLFYHFLIVFIFLTLLFFPFSYFFSSSVDLVSMLSPPSFSHLLGTDNLGRDLLIRISETIRFAVLPLWLGVSIGSFFGTILSLIFIFLSQFSILNFLDKLMLLFASIISSIPIAIACFVVSVLHEEADIFSVLIPLGVLFSFQTFFTINNLFHRDKNLGFWIAHRALGGSLMQRVLKYGFLKAWKNDLFQLFSFQLKAAVVIEASLSYLSFGIQEPSPSFGNILASHFDLYLKGEWFILMIICVALWLVLSTPKSIHFMISSALSRFRNDVT